MSGPGSTLSLREATERRWAALVVGAGPAGSTAGRLLAGSGRSVLIVERSRFPRDKVCGCCVNGAARRLLAGLGLGDVAAWPGGHRSRTLHLFAARGRAEVPVPDGAIISRRTLDATLATRAVEAGCHFLPGTAARVEGIDGDARQVRLRQSDAAGTARAAVVIAADGLSGSSIGHLPDLAARVDPRGRIGAAAFLAPGADHPAPGVIWMACGSGGYVGLVRLADGRLDVAAALDPAAVRRDGGPGPTAGRLLAEAGAPGVPGLAEARWRGTARLTRRRKAVAAARLLVVGDAAGFVEPFTGQGIAWALASAVAAAPLAGAAGRDWDPAIAAAWTTGYRDRVRRSQLTCRLVASAVRRRWLLRPAVALLAQQPSLARPVLHALARSPAVPAPSVFAPCEIPS